MISVAMTTYNGEKYIEQQLYSILNQTRPVDEVIICDDGSNDRTVDIIKSMKDDRIKLVENDSNLGYIMNFKKAISLTQGEYIFLSDQDDIWEPNKVETMVNLMEETGCDALCSNFSLIDKDSRRITNRECLQIDSFIEKAKNRILQISFFRLLFGNIAQGCTYCFTKKIKQVYLEIDNKEVIHDYQIMLIAAAIGKVLFLNEKLIRYRLHDNNSIGFGHKKREWIIKKKKISKKPFMVQFINDLQSVVFFKNALFYKILFYLRIPYIRAVIRKLFLG